MIEQTFQTPLPLELEVTVPAGEIEVETVEGEESTIRVHGDERILENVVVRHDGQRLAVELRGKSKFGFVVAVGSLVFGNDGLHVEARVPHGAALRVKTTSADTDLAGSFQALELNSVSGDIRLRGEVAEDVTVKTVSGDVELERLGGDLTLQTISGDVRVRAVGGSAEAKTVSGDIRLEALSTGDVRFTSVSGDVEIGIAEGSLLDVDAGSSSGDLSSEVPLANEPPSGENGAAPTVVLRGRTVSGDLRVFRAH